MLKEDFLKRIVTKIGGTMELKIGQKAPEFTLPSHLEKDVTLSDLRGKTVVLAFFPKAWTPV